VFCGAKQAPAPVPGAAAQQAKTVLGYQAGDVVKELQRQGVNVPRPGGGANPPMGNAPIGTAPTMARPGGPTPGPFGGPMQPMPQPPPPAGMQPMPSPPAAVPPSQAKTVFIAGGQGPGAPAPMNNAPAQMGGYPPPQQQAAPMPNYPPPPAPMGPPMGGGYPPPPAAPMPMSSAPSAPVVMPNYQAPSAPVVMPNYQAPSAPIPAPMANVPSAPAAPPYLASQTALRASRPVEPFTDGLKLVLLSFGILLLGAFATPLQTDPMAFHWNAIIDAPGVAKLQGLMLVATGVIALVIALMPLAAIPRGAIAAGVGIFIIATPIIQAGAIGPWQELVKTIATIGLVGGLLVRHEYREAMLGRILTTIGAVAVLAIYLIPVGGGDPPLIGMFKALVDAPKAEMKIAAIIALVPAILAIVSLLCWLPAPSSAGAKPLAWTWIVYPAVAIVALGLIGSGGEVAGWIKHSPFGALMSWVPAAAAAAFTGYGVATIAGKSLE
jgi:hypothetical protein